MSFFEDDLFAHLAPSETVDYTLDGVHIPPTNPKPVVLELVYAGKGTPYWNAITKAKPVDDEDESNKRAAALFAQHAIRGWKNVEKNGTAVTYSPEIGGEVLIKLLAAKRFAKVDAVITYGIRPDNFKPPMVEAAELGKP